MSCPPETARLFFAIIPGADVLRGIASVQSNMDLPARPVPAGNLHITLAFLGDVGIGRIDELRAIGASLACPACMLSLDRCGWFPRAGVVWLGSDTPPAELIGFQRRLSEALAGAGFRVGERPWLPHLTLYRKMRKTCARMAIEAVQWRIEGFCLVRSTLTPKGAIYDPIGHWPATE